MTEPRLIRTARWVSLLATVALALAVALAGSAGAEAAPQPQPRTLLELEAEDDEGEEGWTYEEGELCAELEAEAEAEDEEIECEEGDEADAPAATPSECRLTTAVATVAADRAHSRLRLEVRYTALAPTAVSVDAFLRGGKGPLSLDAEDSRFSRRGVFHDSVPLSERQMDKVLAARSFTVQLQAAGAPASCHRFFDRKLTLRRGLTWSEPAARTGR